MTHRWTARRAAFRNHLAGPRCLHPGSVYDPVSARIAHDLGYELGMLAGSVASMAVLGAPDLIVLTLSELADQAHRINRASELPLMVDADHGYGNAHSVMRTVEELEMAGVAGLSIEDTRLPAVYGTPDSQSLLSIEEGTAKMKAALAGRRDPSLVIAGRTSAAAITGIDDAIARARAYAAAGVDAIFLVGVKSHADLDKVAAAVELPLIIGGLPAPLIDAAALAPKRVRICLTGHQPFEAAVQAVHATLKALREGTRPEALAGLPSEALMRAATRADDYERWTRDFLGGPSVKS